jgi:hypothetical protein
MYIRIYTVNVFSGVGREMGSVVSGAGETDPPRPSIRTHIIYLISVTRPKRRQIFCFPGISNELHVSVAIASVARQMWWTVSVSVAARPRRTRGLRNGLALGQPSIVGRRRPVAYYSFEVVGMDKTAGTRCGSGVMHATQGPQPLELEPASTQSRENRLVPSFSPGVVEGFRTLLCPVG